ncbi:MAG: GNAT family N-acetyltransferase, partial [Thermomicrobia bacterium]|nr:GNAT family N-acetyltransferase [Thermomicrobia bacterium]
MLAYHLRQATAADDDFLYRLHIAAMGDLVAHVWGWDDAWQERFFADHFDPTHSRIIVVDGEDVGVIAVEWGAAEALLANIEILPDYQGRGLGAALVNQIIAEAEAHHLPVRLQVLKVNPARRLYERLGFVRTSETETHFLMACLPASHATQF